MATAVTLASASHCASSRSRCVMVPKMRFSRLLVPSSLSLIRHAAMVSLCTSRPQQLRCTRNGDPPLPLAKTPALEESPLRTLRMEVSLCGSYGVQLNLFRGFNEPHHCHYPSLVAQWRIPLCARSPLFSCLVVTEISVMLTCLCHSSNHTAFIWTASFASS